MKTITREQYMEDSEALHHDFYAQFIIPSTFKFVKERIGMKKILASKDEHLNDVCKYFSNYQGGVNAMWDWDLAPINQPLAKELGETFSFSTRTCVAKAAARILIKEQ